MRIAIVFPGQGTQSAGMGNVWKGDPSWSVVEAAEVATGEKLAHLLLDGPKKVSTKQLNDHPLLGELNIYPEEMDALIAFSPKVKLSVEMMG